MRAPHPPLAPLPALVPEDAWATLVEESDTPMLVGRSLDGRILFANRAAEALLGEAPGGLRGRTARSLHPPEDTDIVEQIARSLDATGRARAQSIALARGDGLPAWADLRVNRVEHPDGPLWLATYRDLTRQVTDIQRHAEHVERLTTIGRMAAGVAHEVNNPATALLANLEMVADTIARSGATREVREDCAEMLTDCLVGVQRITRITRELRDYSRAEARMDGEVRLADAVGEALDIVGPTIRTIGTLALDVPPLPPIRGDQGRVVQVLVNLLANARDAIAPGGRVTVRAGAHGDTQFVQVGDDGRGMDADTRARIFQPFFTTKPAGQGTGIGLAVSWRIAVQHGGRLKFESEVGRGTRFTLDLPAQAAEPPTRELVPVPPVHAPGSRVLIVDDESALRRAFRRILAPDHEVRVAAGGAEAQAALASDEFDLVLLDMQMPGMSGAEVFAGMSPAQRARVLFVSAGARTDEERALMDAVGWLSKPVLPQTLRAAVQQRVGQLAPGARTARS